MDVDPTNLAERRQATGKSKNWLPTHTHMMTLLYLYLHYKLDADNAPPFISIQQIQIVKMKQIQPKSENKQKFCAIGVDYPA